MNAYMFVSTMHNEWVAVEQTNVRCMHFMHLDMKLYFEAIHTEIVNGLELLWNSELSIVR